MRTRRTTGGYRGLMAEILTLTLTLTLTLEPRGPAGAFLLSEEQVAAVGGGVERSRCGSASTV
jgi:hypothetical protein